MTVQLAWQVYLLHANTEELRAIVKSPATHIRGYKAFAKRELARRENATRCSQCGRKVQATLFGKCGGCLRLNTTAAKHGDYCCECGEWEAPERLLDGRCPTCHVERITGGVGPVPAGYVRAGEELPPEEVFGKAELKRLAFAKWLVAAGKLEG